jgi:hypothetical protein
MAHDFYCNAADTEDDVLLLLQQRRTELSMAQLPHVL